MQLSVAQNRLNIDKMLIMIQNIKYRKYIMYIDQHRSKRSKLEIVLINKCKRKEKK